MIAAKQFMRAKERGEARSLRRWCAEHGYTRSALQKHMKAIKLQRDTTGCRGGIPTIGKLGRRPYLNQTGVRMLNVYLQAMDRFSLPMEPRHLPTIVRKIKCHVDGITEVNSVKLPSPATISRLKPQLSVRAASITEGNSARKLKSKEHYLVETYATMRELVEQYNFLPCDMFVRFVRLTLLRVSDFIEQLEHR